MLAVLIGTVSAAFFGAADFVGGLAAKRIQAMLVTGLAALAGVVALTIASPVIAGVWHAETWVGGILTGLASCAGIWLLYSAYARGPMTTLAPVVAILSTVVPMAAGLLSGETFSALGWTAVAIGLVAIALVAAAPDGRRTKARPVDLAKAAAAGALLGVFYIYLDSSALDAGLTPLFANRLTCAVAALTLVGILALRRRPLVLDARWRLTAAAIPEQTPGGTLLVAAPVRPATRARSVVLLAAVGLAAASGTLDATANALFTFGLEVGDLSLLSVVTGFYPAVTIGLAFLVLRERPTRLQGIGIVLALVAIGGMSFA